MSFGRVAPHIRPKLLQECHRRLQLLRAAAHARHTQTVGRALVLAQGLTHNHLVDQFLLDQEGHVRGLLAERRNKAKGQRMIGERGERKTMV